MPSQELAERAHGYIEKKCRDRKRQYEGVEELKLAVMGPIVAPGRVCNRANRAAEPAHRPRRRRRSRDRGLAARFFHRCNSEQLVRRQVAPCGPWLEFCPAACRHAPNSQAQFRLMALRVIV